VKNDLIRAAAGYDPSNSMISGYQSTLDADNSVYQRLDDIGRPNSRLQHDVHQHAGFLCAR